MSWEKDNIPRYVLHDMHWISKEKCKQLYNLESGLWHDSAVES